MKDKSYLTAYKNYMIVVKRQLEEAKNQVERIPELERVSKMSFGEWLKFQKIPYVELKCPSGKCNKHKENERNNS
jgi:hypothetical protein